MVKDTQSFPWQAPGNRIDFVPSREGLAAKLAAICPPGRVVIFAGRASYDASGCRQALLPAGFGREFLLFNDIEPEPSTETVERMIRFLRTETPVAVVAAGGGSVMDAAKAAWLATQTGLPLADHFGVNRWSSTHPGQKLKTVIAIPTTSGTGSEATPYANIVDRAAGVKKLISEEAIVPANALLSPDLTLTLPPSVTLATGCDALAHAIEGFLNVGADANHPEVNAWALESIRRIQEFLPRALADGNDREARIEMSRAAALGGMVIRFKSTGLPHLCSFSWFGLLEHGLAVAMLLPAAWSYYLDNPEVAARTLELAEVFPGETPQAVIASYRRFLDRLGVPPALDRIPGITPELLARTARSGGANRMKLELAPCPVPAEEAETVLSQILNQAYHGVTES